MRDAGRARRRGVRHLAAASLALGLALWASAPLAFSPDEPLADAVLEARARALHEELRCMVCQGQAISDSDAELARDMRAVVRQRIADGETDEQVLDYLAGRYGDYILLDPPVKPATYALWFGPAGAFLLGAGLIFFAVMRRSRRARAGAGGEVEGAAPLSAEERRRLEALLSDGD